MNKEIEVFKQQIASLNEEAQLLEIIKDSDYLQVKINLAIEKLLRLRIDSGSIADDSSLLNEEERLASLSNRETPAPSKRRNIWKWVLWIIVLSNLANIIIRGHVLDGFTGFNYLDTPTIILLGLLIYPLGRALFEIRERRLLLYARLEILFGIFSGVYTIGNKTHWGTLKDFDPTDLATWTALALSLYVVVRGLDNRKKAIMRIEMEEREREESCVRTEETRHKAEMEKLRESVKTRL